METKWLFTSGMKIKHEDEIWYFLLTALIACCLHCVEIIQIRSFFWSQKEKIQTRKLRICVFFTLELFVLDFICQKMIAFLARKLIIDKKMQRELGKKVVQDIGMRLLEKS